MPRKKVNVFVDYTDYPMIRGIKVYHDIANNSYSFDLNDVKNKMQTRHCLPIMFEESYIVVDCEKYTFSNILVEKCGKFGNIKVIFEKPNCNSFAQNVNIESSLLEMEFNRNSLYISPFFSSNLFNIKHKNIKTNIYLVGSYIVREGHKLYLSHFSFEKCNSYFIADVDFTPLKDSQLNTYRHFVVEN